MGNSLRKLQIYHLAPRTAVKQIPVVRCLLNHRRVRRVPRFPVLPPVAVAADQPCEEWLGVLGAVVVIGKGGGEFVEGEGEGDRG